MNKPFSKLPPEANAVLVGADEWRRLAVILKTPLSDDDRPVVAGITFILLTTKESYFQPVKLL